MMSCVAGVVRVMPHWICGLSMRSVSIENGSGGSSPGCISTAAQSIVRAVEPRRRAGLQPAERKAEPLQRARQAERRRLADPAGRNLPFADMDQPAQERAGGQHRRRRSRIRGRRPGVRRSTRAVGDRADRPTSASITVRFAVVADRRAASPRHKACGRPGRADRAPPALAAVEHAELDAAGVRHAAHQAVERIDLAHQMALAEPADRRIAGHRADGGEPMRDQRGARAHARGRRRGFAAGVAAADHDDVEYRAVDRHRSVFQKRGGCSQATRSRVKIAVTSADVSRETSCAQRNERSFKPCSSTDS